MTTHQMITVSKYCPLAGTNRNTFRRYSEKYETLQPGDLVFMQYATEFDDNDVPTSVHASEWLTVASVAIGPYKTLKMHHLPRNHGDMDPLACDTFFERCYGIKDGELAEATFMAIYFD